MKTIKYRIFLYTFIFSVLFICATSKFDNSKQTKSAANLQQQNLMPLDSSRQDTTIAAFKGGDQALYDFLNDNLKYPEKSLSKGYSGQAIVAFYIDSDGSLDSLHIHKSAGHDALDQEALRVVGLSKGHWTPSKVNGQPIGSSCRLPINFEMLDE